MFGIDDAAIAMGGSALASGVLGSQATKGAAGDQAKAAAAATAEQQREYDLTRRDTSPYREAGQNALTRIQQLLGFGGPSMVNENDPRFKAIYQPMVDQFDQAHQAKFGMGIYDPRADAASRDQTLDRFKDQAKQQYLQQYGDQAPSVPGSGDLNRKFSVADFWNDPVVQLGYQSGLDLGTKALKNAAPLTTGLDSGAALKELTKFGTDYTGQQAAASQGRYINDQNNQFNKLATLAGVGQTAVGQTTSAGVPISGNISNILTGQGNANAAARVAGANAWTGGLQSVANWWASQNTLNQLKDWSTNYGVGNGYFGGSGPYNQSAAIANSGRYGI